MQETTRNWAIVLVSICRTRPLAYLVVLVRSSEALDLHDRRSYNLSRRLVILRLVQIDVTGIKPSVKKLYIHPDVIIYVALPRGSGCR